MGRKITAERNSCPKLKHLPPTSYCPPCWDKIIERILLIGIVRISRQRDAAFVCIYPDVAGTWQAAEPDGDYWISKDWSRDNWKPDDATIGKYNKYQ
jgi:hypothetical protein